MREDPQSTLSAALGDEVVACLEGLEPAELELLARMLVDARKRQRVALRGAGEEALGHIPRLLRSPVRKVVLR